MMEVVKTMYSKVGKRTVDFSSSELDKCIVEFSVKSPYEKLTWQLILITN